MILESMPEPILPNSKWVESQYKGVIYVSRPDFWYSYYRRLVK